MRDFGRDRRGGGGRDFKRRDFDRPQQMHKTICSNCGKECEVPFKPTGSKPVFCRECFQNNRGGAENFQRRSYDDDNKREFSNNRPQSQENYQQQFNALNEKLDKILRLLSAEKTKEQAMPVVEDAKLEEVVEPKVEVVKAVSKVKKAKAVKLPKELV